MLRASEKMMARKNNEKDVAKLLLNLDHGNIEFNARHHDGQTAIMLACQDGHKETALYFVYPRNTWMCTLSICSK